MTPPKGEPEATAPTPPVLPPLPEDAYTGIVCVCGSAWFVAHVALRDDYASLLVVEPQCADCSTPAPPQVVRDWRSPKVQ